MLVLTRRLGESIVIGNGIIVTVLGIHGRQVRMGIEAPEDVIINREEKPACEAQLWRCCEDKLILFPLPEHPKCKHLRLYSCRHCGTSYLLTVENSESEWVRIQLEDPYSWEQLLDLWNIINPPRKRADVKKLIKETYDRHLFNNNALFELRDTLCSKIQ